MGSVHRDTFRGGMPMAGRAQRGNLPVAFTSEQLREAGEYELLCGRQADWCQRLVTRAETEWISDREAALPGAWRPWPGSPPGCRVGSRDRGGSAGGDQEGVRRW